MGELPPVAMAYYLRVLRTTYPAMGVRSARELATLATVLDHLAEGDCGAAADVVAQRLKAVEKSIVDGSWEGARQLELIEADDATLLGQREERLIRHEVLQHRRMQEVRPGKGKGDGYRPGGYDYWQGREKGKGNPFKGKKGKKSDGKGKAKGAQEERQW